MAPTPMPASLRARPEDGDAVTLRARLRAGALTAQDALRACEARIDAVEPWIHAWVDRDPQPARARAAALDAAPGGVRAQPGLLAGLPIALKDLIDTRDWPTACGSPLRAGLRPARDALIVERLLDQGAVPVGKTVTTEFGYFQPGPTANPWNPAHTPGGSSSGSAAAVAAGMVTLALGTQTAGSLIRPAAYCGVWALKPTFERYPLDGVQGLSPSMDTLGWMARSADDLELLRCALDRTPWAPLPPVNPTLRWSLTHEWPLMSPEGAATFHAGLQRLREDGLSLQEWVLPDALKGLFDAQRTIMAREAAQTLAVELRDHRDQLGTALQQLLDSGHRVSEADDAAARALAEHGRRTLDALLADCDALLVPGAPGEAPAGLAATGDPAFSRVWNLLGLPCVQIPGLLGPRGLPVGLQLVGRCGQERALLSAAKAIGHCLAQTA